MCPMPVYHVAAFAADGSLVGVGSWDRAALSPQWLAVAAALVESATRSGRAVVPIEHLNHLALQVSEASGAMLATYYAHDTIAASTLLLRGGSLDLEAALIRMFVHSLRSAAPVARLQAAEPFAALFSLAERP